MRGQTSKAPQTTKGQAGLIRAIEQAGIQFYNNGYLGERNYIDPDDAQTKYTKTGFVMLSKPEDILDLLSTDRAARKSANPLSTIPCWSNPHGGNRTNYLQSIMGMDE